MKKANIQIGTSGWHYKHWKGTFYPEGTKDADQLKYYIRTFKTVELNNSFYRMPTAGTFTNWRAMVPDDFMFAVKANRYITHLKKLIIDPVFMQQFFQQMDHLAEKLGPVLFQLPPGWKKNRTRLSDFLNFLPKNYRYTVEFRNHSWYEPSIYELLKKHNAAFCLYELGGHLSPMQVTADFVYMRLHGPGGKYEGSYSDETLKKWADLCVQWQHEGKDVYVYFDNDQSGYAAFNAKRLLELVK